MKIGYVQDTPRSRAPLKITPEIKAVIVKAIDDGDRNQRAKPAALLGYENNMSGCTMLRIWKRNTFKPCKTTKKSGLTEEMKKARLIFCRMYEHWTIED